MENILLIILGVLGAGYLYQRSKRNEAEVKNKLSETKIKDEPFRTKEGELSNKISEKKKEVEKEKSPLSVGDILNHWNKKDK